MSDMMFQKINGVAVPYTVFDADTWAEFKDNQIVKGTVTGTTLEPSLEQLDLFMACCELIAENTELPRLNTKEKVLFNVKVAIHYVKTERIAVDNAGNIVFEYDSISFRTQEKKRRRFFEDGFPVLAGYLGVDVETMVAEAQSKMGPRRHEVVRKYENTR